MDDLQAGPLDMILPAYTINDYLDSAAQIECLVDEYLQPLRGQLDGNQRKAFDGGSRPSCASNSESSSIHSS